MHKPVLLKQAKEVLNPRPGEFFIDGTVDGGGHAAMIIENIEPDGIFLGIDWDKNMIDKLNSKFENQRSKLKNLILVNDNYANLPEILKRYNLPKADGILIDLGFSSDQLEAGRGFSFLKDEPLDMRYNTAENFPAAEIINNLDENSLADIFFNYGGERQSRKIAKAIAIERKKTPIETTAQLSAIILRAVGRNYERGRINPSTRVFQALRIFVNKELENLEKALGFLPEILKSGSGRVALISFHSLEDKLIKNEFKKIAEANRGKILTKKPVAADREEILANPRARSAKLRALQIV
ncbi:MAG: 16S rRNA (cytosine(1402)-N(4))-methyltransferase RsmH [Patescibacteria group bacterium]|nr:16S rRNA (cytosine(1402)-N(4))-methyltransferase RsmH [Patescibacteria group bacterium]